MAYIKKRYANGVAVSIDINDSYPCLYAIAVPREREKKMTARQTSLSYMPINVITHQRKNLKKNC